MRHERITPSIRYSVIHDPRSDDPQCNWRVYDNHTGATVEGWLTYEEADALVDELTGEPANDNYFDQSPEYPRHDREASRADERNQLSRESE